jgi:hypothetical protein
MKHNASPLYANENGGIITIPKPRLEEEESNSPLQRSILRNAV